jgi:hypothetical protein
MRSVNSGKLSLAVGGQEFRAEWRVTGRRVEISSDIGSAEAALGALASASAAVAREKFREMVRVATKPPKPASPRRFDLRDV